MIKYNPETGLFNKKGYVELGYLRIRLKGKQYMAHRLAWLYSYGEWPKYIDHINHDKTDNRIANLRSVSHTENMKNKPKYKNNKSGITGVYQMEKNWRVLITSNKKRMHVGYYPSLFDAACARKSAENKLGFHKNHG